jgi:hypothetical protein
MEPRFGYPAARTAPAVDPTLARRQCITRSSADRAPLSETSPSHGFVAEKPRARGIDIEATGAIAKVARIAVS